MKEKVYRSCQLELKEMDETKGLVSFYFAGWNEDLDRDIILPGAYSKTLKENQKNIYHNRDHRDPVGTPIELGVDNKGAYCVSQLALKTIAGNDTFEQYKAGLVKGHSQEFQTILSDYDTKAETRTIKELKLWGVTTVTKIPANLDTPTISLKSYQDALDYLKKIKDLLTKGKISDETGERFVQEYKALYEIIQKKEKEFHQKQEPAPLVTRSLVDKF